MKNKKVSIITLGCPKNTVESESVAGLFVGAGFDLTNDLLKSDIAVIHTCSFIKDAQIESEKWINAVMKLKQKKQAMKVFVSGCLPQLLKDEMREKFPFVDGYTGTGGYGKIIELIKKGRFFAETRVPGGMNDSRRRVLSDSLPSAYIKIAEGCNHACSFCIIPQLRGRYESRTIRSVTEEAKALAGFGIKELNVIAQDTSCYGTDIYGRPSLDRLLKSLSKIDGLKWIRLLYAYPSTVNSRLLDVINENDNICKYVDIPVQHVSRNVLKNMRRPLDTAKIIEGIKKKYPEIVLRTSLITGFPGETEKDFRQAASFVKENYFEHIGIFDYSDQEKSKSFQMGGKIKNETAQKRKSILASLQFKNVVKNNAARKGKTFEVFVEKVAGSKAEGRAWFQAPEIDSKFIIDFKSVAAKPGEFKKIVVCGFKDYDIIGKP